MQIRVLQDPLLSGSKAAQAERRALLRRLPTPAAGWVGSSPSGVSSLVLIFAGSQRGKNVPRAVAADHILCDVQVAGAEPPRGERQGSRASAADVLHSERLIVDADLIIRDVQVAGAEPPKRERRGSHAILPVRAILPVHSKKRSAAEHVTRM